MYSTIVLSFKTLLDEISSAHSITELELQIRLKLQAINYSHDSFFYYYHLCVKLCLVTEFSGLNSTEKLTGYLSQVNSWIGRPHLKLEHDLPPSPGG